MPPSDDEARRAARGKVERLSSLPKLVMGVKVPPPPTVPPVPMRAPEYDSTPAEPIRVRARQREQTKTGIAPPRAGSAPLPPPVASLPPPPVYKRSVSPIPWDDRPEARREAERQGDRVVEAPPSVPPTPPAPPSGFAVDVQAGGQRVRVQGSSSVVRKVWPWLAPVVLSVVGACVGYVKGYFEGLAAAGRRVAAVEEGLKLNGEDDARRATRVTSDINRAFVVIDDHDARIPKLESRMNKTEERLPKIEGLPPAK